MSILSDKQLEQLGISRDQLQSMLGNMTSEDDANLTPQQIADADNMKLGADRALHAILETAKSPSEGLTIATIIVASMCAGTANMRKGSVEERLEFGYLCLNAMMEATKALMKVQIEAKG